MDMFCLVEWRDAVWTIGKDLWSRVHRRWSGATEDSGEIVSK